LKPSRSIRNSATACFERRSFAQRLEFRLKLHAVGQAGQHVELGEIADFIEQLLLGGDVLLHPEYPHRHVILAFDRGGDADPAAVALAGDDLGVEAEACVRR
jgi:hypothetical protein